MQFIVTVIWHSSLNVVYIGHPLKAAATELDPMLGQWSKLFGIYHSVVLFPPRVNPFGKTQTQVVKTNSNTDKKKKK